MLTLTSFERRNADGMLHQGGSLDIAQKPACRAAAWIPKRLFTNLSSEWNDKTVSPQTLPDRSTPLALGQRTQTRIIAKQNEERIVGRHESGNGTWPFARQALDPQAQSFQSRKHTRTQPRSYANVASGTASQNVNVSRHVQPGSWNRKPAGNPHSASLPRGQTISPKEALSIPQSKASINPSIAVPTTPARQIQNFQSLDISDREKDDSPHKSLADAQEQNKLGTTQDEHMVFRHKPNAAVYLPFSVSIRQVQVNPMLRTTLGVRPLACSRCAPNFFGDRIQPP